jgi:hypothetical protein
MSDQMHVFYACAYVKIIAMAEQSWATVCNIAFPRASIVEDIKQFAKEVLPSYLS